MVNPKKIPFFQVALLTLFSYKQLKESMDEGVTDEEYEDEDEYIYDSPPSVAD